MLQKAFTGLLLDPSVFVSHAAADPSVSVEIDADAPVPGSVSLQILQVVGKLNASLTVSDARLSDSVTASEVDFNE